MVHQSQFIARFGTTEQSSFQVKTLREISLSSGEYGANTPATKFDPEKGRYIRITDIDEFGNLNNDMVSPEVADDKYLLQKGDLLFARTGATVGKTYLHKSGKALYAGYLIKYQLIDSVLPEFVFAYTHSKEYYQWVELTQKVGAQPNISAKQYDGLRIIVPPIEEQNAFVVLMKQADKSKFDGLKSQFIEQFGTPDNNYNGYSVVPFSEMCYDDTKSATKIPADDYKESGAYAIFDQSTQNYIAGYYNAEQGANNDYPAILFGDHSRMFKYIQQPFFIGADGVKIIRLKTNEYPEFIYYELLYSYIPNTGYNRHFKWVKELSLRIVEPQEQQQFLRLAHQADKSKYLN